MEGSGTDALASLFQRNLRTIHLMKTKRNDTPRTMKSTDLAILHDWLEHPPPGWRPNPVQSERLEQLLGEVKAVESGSGVGLGQRVLLVNPYDPEDSLELKVVLPSVADPDRDEVSVYLPVSLAVLGTREGDWVTWETPRGERKMMVERVEQSEAGETVRGLAVGA